MAKISKRNPHGIDFGQTTSNLGLSDETVSGNL